MALFTEKLRENMAIEPARTVIRFAGADHSWAELKAQCDAIEAALSQLSVPRDGRVGILLRNRPGHVAALAAVLVGERCLVTLNPAFPDERLFADLADLGLQAVILDAEDWARPGLSAVLSDAGVAAILFSAGLSGVRLQLPARLGLYRTSPGVAIEMLTSGTTGRPKRVPLTRDAFDASFTGFVRYERGRELADRPKLHSGTTMVANPLAHIGGAYGVIGALMAGRTIALLEKFSVPEWVDLVKTARLKVAGAVPSMVRMLMDADLPRDNLSSLSAIISGTAPLSPDLVDAFLEKYGVPVLSNYGATELAGGVAGWTLDDFRAHWTEKRKSSGRLHANVAARVVDAESGKVLPVGDEGLLELQGAQLGPDFPIGGTAWLRTTDRARIDADNFLYVLGRADATIIRGGFKIHPEDVIEVLNRHPSIREAAVVGIADERLGQVPVAAIILSEGARRPDEADLREWLRQRLIAYQLPVAIRIVEDFPRTPSMKPSADGLRQLFVGDTPAS